MHTLPEILTVMDLITIYATDSSTDPDLTVLDLITLYAIDPTSNSDHDRRIRRESKKSKAILRCTLSHLINASKDYHNARPYQFQVLCMILTKRLSRCSTCLLRTLVISLIYIGPPVIDARRIISSITTHITHIRDAYHEENDIPAGLTRVATFQISA